MASDIGVFFVHMDFVFLFQSFGNGQGFAFSLGDGMMVVVTSAYFFGYGVNVGSYNKDSVLGDSLVHGFGFSGWNKMCVGEPHPSVG